MLISTRYTPQGWMVDENTANLIPEFREILSSDFGVKALAFIALTKDPTSFLSEVYEEEETRKQQAFISVYEKGDIKKLLKNKVITDGLAKYESICDTTGMKLRNHYRQGVVAVGKFIFDNKDSIKLDSFDKYMTALSKLPAQIIQYDEMKKGDEGDIEQVKKIIRGGRELSYLEKKQSAKRKKA